MELNGLMKVTSLIRGLISVCWLDVMEVTGPIRGEQPLSTTPLFSIPKLNLPFRGCLYDKEPVEYLLPLYYPFYLLYGTEVNPSLTQY